MGQSTPHVMQQLRQPCISSDPGPGETLTEVCFGEEHRIGGDCGVVSMNQRPFENISQKGICGRINALEDH
jgi:hypothetical protein